MVGLKRICTNLSRLLRDNAGNTLAIAAASLIPLMALIGGGVDISRAYMAKTQLQSACDAGVLAGRRAMSKSGSYGDNEMAKANSMFNFNFNGDALRVRDLTYTTEDNDDGQVLGTASATLPTLVMKIFDKDTVDLTVNCMAELQIGNADIMFVLDTTGSMGDPISWGEDDKIVGLRDAVEDFHKTINQAINDNRTRVRYGFVPYSMTVNAKELVSSGDMPSTYFVSSTTYQSRLAEFHNRIDVPTTEDLGTSYETYGSEISENDCRDYGRNRYPYRRDNPERSGSPPGTVTSKEYDYYDWDYTRRVGGNWWGGGGTRIGWCKRRVWTSRTTYESEYAFSGWDYRPVGIDTSGYRGLGSVSYASSLNSNSRVKEYGNYTPVELAKMKAAGEAENIGTSSSTWNGCIEERASEDPSWSYDFDPIPEDALDLNLSLIPVDGDPDTKWKPMWGDLEYTYSGYSGWSHPSSACPSPMKLLTEVTLSDDPNDVPQWLEDYLDDLDPQGNTYHDIGMIWGGRLTSATGIFADNVTKDADKINVSKHIIFMTDGIMQPTSSGYSAYGVENYDHRIAPSGSEGSISARHTARFNAVCEAIKAQGTTIWVIAFGTSMTDSLRDCASDGRAYYSSNTQELRNTFKFIAAQVADLRLGA